VVIFIKERNMTIKRMVMIAISGLLLNTVSYAAADFSLIDDMNNSDIQTMQAPATSDGTTLNSNENAGTTLPMDQAPASTGSTDDDSTPDTASGDDDY
jgi:hypothetical protein